MLFSILTAVMVVLGILLVVLILLQQGKGADAGAAFGSGASGTVFGSRGSGSFLSKLTGVLMAAFMILAVAMAWLGQHGAANQVSTLMAGGGNVPAAVTSSAAGSAGTLEARTALPAGVTGETAAGAQTSASAAIAAPSEHPAEPAPAPGSGG